MQSSLKKSLYLGLAALSFAGVAAVSTTASAKSYATAGAYTTLKTDATTRNVEATGTNALYTKPGTVKGAKVVASKATMAKLASSKKSADYFRAYGVKTTNRGSVYYRVVSMDGKYRGYVYGGSSDTAFAGGIKSASTTTTKTNPTKLQNYYLKDVSKNTLWTAPKYTQYKASKVNLYGAAKDDPFVVDQAATKTREGSLYYHVTDRNNSKISGWIYAGKGYDATLADSKQDLGGLSLDVSEDAATADNSVSIVYRTADGAKVGSSTWIVKNPAAATHADGDVVLTDTNAANTTLPNYVTQNVPDGYTVTSGAVASAKYGQTTYVTVAKAATSKVAMKVNSVNNHVKAADGTVADTATTVSPVLTVGSSLATADITVNPTDLSVLKGQTGTALTEAQLNAITTSLGVAAVQGNKNYTDANGNYYHYEFTLNTNDFNSDNRNAQFGDTLTASYDAQLVAGKATNANSSDTSWLA
ncbi:S-layer protein [Levilactobacillus brevis]|uniref:S-layer protein n=1 Tax=Levilactobacillus brevis TaxID=1580 RepID=UPI00255C74D8|nr:S-layer protein [Levilactobacillus brevis]